MDGGSVFGLSEAHKRKPKFFLFCFCGRKTFYNKYLTSSTGKVKFKV